MDRTDQKARMAYGNDFALLCLDAVDYAIVSDKDLPYVVPAKFTHHHTGFRKVRKMFNAFKDFIFPAPGGSPVAAFGGNVVPALANSAALIGTPYSLENLKIFSASVVGQGSSAE